MLVSHSTLKSTRFGKYRYQSLFSVSLFKYFTAILLNTLKNLFMKSPFVLIVLDLMFIEHSISYLYNTRFWWISCSSRLSTFLCINLIKNLCKEIKNIPKDEERKLHLRRSQVTGDIEIECIFQRVNEFLTVCYIVF